MKRSSLLLSSGVTVAGCGSSGTSCPEGQVDCDGVCIDTIAADLPSIQTQIFDLSCTASACHDADLPAQDLDLSSVSSSAQNLVGVNSTETPTLLRVEAGNSGSSYLMNKVLGENMALGTARMPLNSDGFVLCEPQIDAIRQWIDGGAN